jgi:hypothetical protein
VDQFLEKFFSDSRDFYHVLEPKNTMATVSESAVYELCDTFHLCAAVLP